MQENMSMGIPLGSDRLVPEAYIVTVSFRSHFAFASKPEAIAAAQSEAALGKNVTVFLLPTADKESFWNDTKASNADVWFDDDEKDSRKPIWESGK